MPPKARPPIERFVEKFTTDLSTGCWLWTNFIEPKTGYGLFRMGYGTTQAHRAAWELFRGTIPDGMHVDHLCRVKRCVNPAHLEPVTPLENTARGLSRKRSHCAAGHPMAGDNIGNRRDGRRYCKTCHREKAQAARAAGRQQYLERHGLT